MLFQLLYLGDTIGQSRSCADDTLQGLKQPFFNFSQFWLTEAFLTKIVGECCCVRSVLLYGSEPTTYNDMIKADNGIVQ